LSKKKKSDVLGSVSM